MGHFMALYQKGSDGVLVPSGGVGVYSELIDLGFGPLRVHILPCVHYPTARDFTLNYTCRK